MRQLTTGFGILFPVLAIGFWTINVYRMKTGSFDRRRPTVVVGHEPTASPPARIHKSDGTHPEVLKSMSPTEHPLVTPRATNSESIRLMRKAAKVSDTKLTQMTRWLLHNYREEDGLRASAVASLRRSAIARSPMPNLRPTMFGPALEVCQLCEFELPDDIMFLLTFEAMSDPGIILWRGVDEFGRRTEAEQNIFQPAKRRIQFADHLAALGPQGIDGLFQLWCLDDYRDNTRWTQNGGFQIGESGFKQRQRVRERVIEHLRTLANDARGVELLARLFRRTWESPRRVQITVDPASGISRLWTHAVDRAIGLQRQQRLLMAVREWPTGTRGRQEGRQIRDKEHHGFSFFAEPNSSSRQPGGSRDVAHGYISSGQRQSGERALLQIAVELGSRGRSILLAAERSAFQEVRDQARRILESNGA